MKDQIRLQLQQRGVALERVAELVLALQRPYHPQLQLKQCLEAVDKVVSKREVQCVLLTGMALDALAEKGNLPEPLQTLVAQDEPLFGIDEVLGMAIANIYGTIGITSFGYLDKQKSGLVGELHSHAQGRCHTFLDDLVAAIASAAAAKIAHQEKRLSQEQAEDKGSS